MDKQDIETESKGIENKVLILRANPNRKLINDMVREIFTNYNNTQFDYKR